MKLYILLAQVLSLGIPTKVLASTINMGKVEQFGAYTVSTVDETVKPFGDSLERILSTVIGFLTIFAGLYFMINFIVGGINLSTAGGDTNKVEDAKKRMTNGALGLIIVVASYSIIYIIGTVLGIDILNLSATIENSFK